AVVRLANKHRPDHLQGLIPTGWIPAGVVLSPDNLQLAVINSKGLGAGPNLQGPNPYLDPESTDSQYVGSMIVGTLSLIDVPDQGELHQDTQQVIANDHFFGAIGGDEDGSDSAGAGQEGSSAQSLSALQVDRSNQALLGRDVLSALSGAAVSSSATANAVISNSASSLAGIGSLAATDPTSPASSTSQTPSQGFMPAATLPAALPLTRVVTDWSQPLFTFFDVVGLQWETSDHSDVL